MSEFKASDPAVRDLAAIFALKGWKWATRNGNRVDPFVPKASELAANLERLYESARMGGGAFGNDEGRPNAGHAESGRLFVSWIDQGYGDEISFGITYSHPPMHFRGVK